MFEAHVCICMIRKDPGYCKLALGLRHFWYQSLALLKRMFVFFLNEDRRFVELECISECVMNDEVADMHEGKGGQIII